MLRPPYDSGPCSASVTPVLSPSARPTSTSSSWAASNRELRFGPNAIRRPSRFGLARAEARRPRLRPASRRSRSVPTPAARYCSRPSPVRGRGIESPPRRGVALRACIAFAYRRSTIGPFAGSVPTAALLSSDLRHDPCELHFDRHRLHQALLDGLSTAASDGLASASSRSSPTANASSPDIKAAVDRPRRVGRGRRQTERVSVPSTIYGLSRIPDRAGRARLTSLLRRGSFTGCGSTAPMLPNERSYP